MEQMDPTAKVAEPTKVEDGAFWYLVDDRWFVTADPITIEELAQIVAAADTQEPLASFDGEAEDRTYEGAG
jgi:hypothetical protein